MAFHYKIKEAADILGVSTRSLKNWEKQGLIVPPRRRACGHRQYSEVDIIQIREFLKHRHG